MSPAPSQTYFLGVALFISAEGRQSLLVFDPPLRIRCCIEVFYYTNLKVIDFFFSFLNKETLLKTRSSELKLYLSEGKHMSSSFVSNLRGEISRTARLNTLHF